MLAFHQGLLENLTEKNLRLKETNAHSKEIDSETTIISVTILKIDLLDGKFQL